MDTTAQVFSRYEDDSGKALYCPVEAVADAAAESRPALDDCVKASTAGRYAGNIEILDRFV